MSHIRANKKFLIDYCMKHTELYNEVANHLYNRFGIQAAEITLLVTYYVAEERRKNNDKNNIKKEGDTT